MKGRKMNLKKVYKVISSIVGPSTVLLLMIVELLLRYPCNHGGGGVGVFFHNNNLYNLKYYQSFYIQRCQGWTLSFFALPCIFVFI
jgi:hypothetical protein